MIRDDIINAVASLRRYTTADQWTDEQIADAILLAVPQIRGLDGLHCHECGGNLTELDLVLSDGLCGLCRDVQQAVPA